MDALTGRILRGFLSVISGTMNCLLTGQHRGRGVFIGRPGGCRRRQKMKKKQGSRSIYKYNRRFWTAQSLAQTLESRVLLSATANSSPAQQQIAQIAQSMVEQPFVQVIKPTSGSVSPLATSPIGLTPSQVRGAYGLGQIGSSLITFGAVQGDGRGQTIAIIDAFDQP